MQACIKEKAGWQTGRQVGRQPLRCESRKRQIGRQADEQAGGQHHNSGFKLLLEFNVF